MFRFFRKRKETVIGTGTSKRAGAWAIESLEARQLLSASAGPLMHYDSTVLNPSATTASSIQGYTPSEISKAYGFNAVSFSASGSTPANGQGQTIAIVDAYNDPKIVSDLGVFDSQFGLSAPPSFKIVNQTGGSSLPTTDPGWAGEISLDVEWAHAIAPGANILLVEANSEGTTDLMAGVDYARHASDVSVVSVSWGGSEFFSWGGGESASQTNYDPIFTTPAGHQGVTFVAAAGDSGAQAGVQWPASSPNVLSVGGTSLYTSDAAGTYQTESSWSGTSSGYSQIEPQPAFQNNVQNSGARSTADVSYNADPNNGFAMYDSLPDSGYSGWQVVGGTSAGAPQWAALIAIADQGRAAVGASTLDGATQTLPMLYNLYGDGTSSGYASYTSYFNDVIDASGGGGGPWHWRWGGYGYAHNSATVGYDLATGLGSPKAGALVNALVKGSSTSNSPGPTGSNGSTNTGGTSPITAAALPASPLIGAFTSAPAVSVIEGTSGVLKLQLTNTSNSKFAGPVTITLYASTDNSLSADDTAIATITLKNVTLKSSASAMERLKFSYPTSLAGGTYDILGSISAVNTSTAASEADALAPVMITPPTVDLATTLGSNGALIVTPGRADTAVVSIANIGNVLASGTLNLALYSSANTTLDSSAVVLASLYGRAIHIRPGHFITVRIRFMAPAGKAAGSYNLIAVATSVTNPSDNNAANNNATATTV
ncbi:MAG TPA: S53 family peptidase [Tepidisphaeraceae bacterium]|nr:S53 family peptidase [Tepidisphaeraceae bacterium]